MLCREETVVRLGRRERRGAVERIVDDCCGDTEKD